MCRLYLSGKRDLEMSLDWSTVRMEEYITEQVAGFPNTFRLARKEGNSSTLTFLPEEPKNPRWLKESKILKRSKLYIVPHEVSQSLVSISTVSYCLYR